MDKEKTPRKKDASEVVYAAGSTASAVFKIIGTIFLIFITTGLLFACIFAYYVKTCIMPGVGLDLDDYTLKQSSIIYYEEDGQWKELVTLSGSEKRIWVDYEDIPWYMEKALVSIEDHRFYTHKGVDWFRTVGAFGRMFTGGSTYGGSTITQQLIKNLTHQDDITVQRKLLEIFQALDFEKNHDKSEIIEWYLNAVYFGEGCYGVQAAAETYFGKNVQDLSLAECASIVGITNLPTYYDPFYSVQNNKDRQETVLRRMYDLGYITKDEYESAKAEELDFVRGEKEPYTPTIYSWYVETVISDVINDLAAQKGLSKEAAETLLYNAGYQVYSCVDMNIQKKVDEIYQNYDNLPKSYGTEKEPLQSAIVVEDQYTGKIVAISGGAGEKTINYGLNRATDSTRPPGSSIKPISIYGPAIEYGLISPSTLVLDSDGDHIKLKNSPNDWFPVNSPNSYDGVITILQALVRSKNTVSAQILDKLTVSASFDYLVNKLCITSLIDDDCNYPALALGQPNWGISVREMCQAYCALANDGVLIKAHTYTKVLASDKQTVVLDNTEPESHQAFSQSTARTMTYMLNNAATYGTGYESRLSNMPTAGKTGTSSSAKDRWFCGYTPYYTAAVWTGYDHNYYMSFSGNPATQIWQKVMSAIHEGLEYKDFVISYGGGATGIFGSKEELEDQMLTEEEKQAKAEEEARKKAEEEAKNNPDTPSPTVAPAA